MISPTRELAMQIYSVARDLLQRHSQTHGAPVPMVVLDFVPSQQHCDAACLPPPRELQALWMLSSAGC